MSDFFDLGSGFGSDFTSDLRTDFEELDNPRPREDHRKSKKRIPDEDRFRVLLTGKNQRIAVNIADHLNKEKGYKTSICASEGEALLREINYMCPHVIIICLGNENSSTSRDYDVLLDCDDSSWLSTIVVADKEDYSVFKAHSKLTNLFYLPRPVAMETLFTKLYEVEVRAEKEQYETDKPEIELEEPEAEDILSPGGNRKKILIVDDDPEQLMQIKIHLSNFYEVRAVRSGPPALEYLKKHPVDLMLLDYMMPEMDGPAVLTQIRESGEYPWIPVIFLTGVTEKKQVIKTLVDFKPEGYIVKPAKKSELVAKIIDVLG